MNFNDARRYFIADPDNIELAIIYFNSVNRIHGYENLSNRDKALYIGANITLNRINEEHVRYCASLGDEVCSIIFPNRQEMSVRYVLREINDKKFSVRFAVWCAEKVLEIFENEFPDDNRPRLAIDAANTWLEDQSEENAMAADAAARAAAYDAASHAATYAAYATTYAARAADYAAYAAYAARVLGNTTDKELLIKYLMMEML